MAVIINDLEIVLDADANTQKGGAAAIGTQAPEPDKPPLGTLDIITVLDRERRNYLRVMAH